LQAHLLLQAQQVLTEEQLLSLLPLMGYKPQRHKLKELTALLLLDPSAVLALHQGILSPKSGKLLSRLILQDQRTLVELIELYRPGGSKQQKLVEMVTELSLRDNKPVGDMLREWLPPHQEAAHANMPQWFQALLQTLDERIRPNKAEAEKTFKRFVQELQPPAGMTVEHSLSFEDESLEVHLRFTDSANLREQWGRLKALMQPN
jgi:ParB family chromosome partitioning protein